MLELQIDNPEIEYNLKSQFENTKDMKEHICNLLIEDFEDKQLLKKIQEEHKKDFVSKKEIFEVLDIK